MRSLLFFVLAPALSGCGPTGPGGYGFCASDNPVISSLSINPVSALVGEGGGSIDADVSFDYRAKDGTKIILVFYRLVAADGTRVVNEAIDQELKRSGSFGFTLPVPTGSAGVLTLRVQVVDECFSESRWAELEFPVEAVAAIGGKTDYAVVRLGAYAYLVGGRDTSGGASATLLRYNPASGLAERKAPLPEGRYASAAAIYGDYIFVFGGIAHGFAQDAVFQYDPRVDGWTARTPMPEPVGRGYAYRGGGFIYVSGDGRTSRYDPELDSWERLAGWPDPE